MTIYTNLANCHSLAYFLYTFFPILSLSLVFRRARLHRRSQTAESPYEIAYRIIPIRIFRTFGSETGRTETAPSAGVLPVRRIAQQRQQDVVMHACLLPDKFVTFPPHNAFSAILVAVFRELSGRNVIEHMPVQEHAVIFSGLDQAYHMPEQDCIQPFFIDKSPACHEVEERRKVSAYRLGRRGDVQVGVRNAVDGVAHRYSRNAIHPTERKTAEHFRNADAIGRKQPRRRSFKKLIRLNVCFSQCPVFALVVDGKRKTSHQMTPFAVSFSSSSDSDLNSIRPNSVFLFSMSFFLHRAFNTSSHV